MHSEVSLDIWLLYHVSCMTCFLYLIFFHTHQTTCTVRRHRQKFWNALLWDEMFSCVQNEPSKIWIFRSMLSSEEKQVFWREVRLQKKRTNFESVSVSSCLPELCCAYVTLLWKRNPKFYRGLNVKTCWKFQKSLIFATDCLRPDVMWTSIFRPFYNYMRELSLHYSDSKQY